MKIIKKINVKAKMTNDLRKSIIEDYQAVIKNLDEDIKKLDDKMVMLVQAISKQNPTQAVIVRQQISIEKSKIEKNKDRLKKEIAKTSRIPNGELVNRGTVDSILEIKAGDKLSEITKIGEIIVENDTILKIKD